MVHIFDKLPAGVSLNIPLFMSYKGQFTTEEAKLCYKIGRSRIHVERASERIKNYYILKSYTTSILSLFNKEVSALLLFGKYSGVIFVKRNTDKYEFKCQKNVFYGVCVCAANIHIHVCVRIREYACVHVHALVSISICICVHACFRTGMFYHYLV